MSKEQRSQPECTSDGQTWNNLSKKTNNAVLCVLVVQLYPTLCNPMHCSQPGSSVHEILQNTGVDCHSLLQGIFPTQGSNLGLPTLQADSLLPEPPAKPK